MAKLRLKKYTDFIISEAVKLLAIDSPSGYTENAARWVMEEFTKLGFEPKQTIKGGVLVKLGNGPSGPEKRAREALAAPQGHAEASGGQCAAKQPGGLLLEAHCDTLGGMVSEVHDGGRLSVTPLGGMNANNAEAENVRIVGRGILDHPLRGIEITYSKNVLIDGITVLNPAHYTVYGGQSENITIRNLKSFSARSWSDGIDLMSCRHVRIENCFLRTSDDCIALYNHRWWYWGNSEDFDISRCVFWPDVAHSVNIGSHGDDRAERGEVLSGVRIRSSPEGSSCRRRSGRRRN